MNRVCLALFFAALMVSACSSHRPPGGESVATDLTIKFKPPNRMRFSGKGAGAGMMLMSSMGATGMAIGVAIDEGIGKDIAAAMKADNYFFPQQFEQSFNAFDPKLKAKIKQLLVERYGFKTRATDGVEDAITVELLLSVELISGELIAINYPDEFQVNDDHVMELEEAKSNGTRSSELLDIAITEVMIKLEEKLSLL